MYKGFIYKVPDALVVPLQLRPLIKQHSQSICACNKFIHLYRHTGKQDSRGDGGGGEASTRGWRDIFLLLVLFLWGCE